MTAWGRLWRDWRANAPYRRNRREIRAARREIRRDSRVICEGDTATHWSGMDFEVCGKPSCQMPRGGACEAVELTRLNYEARCRNAGIAP